MGNMLVHWELMVSDPEKSKAFYGKVFDWQFDDTSMPGYTGIEVGEEGRGGGLMQRPPDAPANALNTYFGVDDVEATLAKAAAAGAKVVVPKTEVPGIGYWAMFADPDGIPIGIFQEAME